MRLLAVLTIMVASFGVTAGSASADVPELGVCKADAELTIGSAGSSVVCVQWALLWMGYFHGLIDGVYAQSTSDAVLKFQQDNPPLTVNGNSGAQTLSTMGIYSGVDKAPPPACLADAPVKPGDRGLSTECLQQTLQTKGLFGGAVDGAFGPSTAAAVKTFQRQNPPLNSDGVAGNSTLAALGIWSGWTRVDQASPVMGNWWPAGFQPEPNWRVTAQGIPYYNGHHICTRENADIIADEFAKDGADPSTQQYFIYIASREGGCDFHAVNINPATKDDSHCTFQINALSGTFEPGGELGRRGWTKDNVKESMPNCADAASDLWVFCARGPWTPPYSCAPPWAGDLGPEGDA
jgi:peptidoglycan hydrolase-like protein with peptidoglycan-binding domain